MILSPNHFSQWDHFFAAAFIRRKVRFMAKSQLFTNPVITWILHMGAPFRCGAESTTKRRSSPRTRFSSAADAC